jgi:hypothetical protein
MGVACGPYVAGAGELRAAHAAYAACEAHGLALDDWVHVYRLLRRLAWTSAARTMALRA